MPKLYFYDTGLACWLLGIREARQLRSHPLRGALFETWAVSETIKLRANRASTPDLSFYRDRNGAEADLIIERPAGLTLLDAKSSATPSDSLFSGVRRVRRHFPDAPAHDVAIAYGGEEYQQRSGGRLIPWRMLRAAALPDADPAVRVFAEGRPLADAGILALFSDNTWKRAKTGKDGKGQGARHRVEVEARRRRSTRRPVAHRHGLFACRPERHRKARRLALDRRRIRDGQGREAGIIAAAVVPATVAVAVTVAVSVPLSVPGPVLVTVAVSVAVEVAVEVAVAVLVSVAILVLVVATVPVPVVVAVVVIDDVDGHHG